MNEEWRLALKGGLQQTCSTCQVVAKRNARRQWLQKTTAEAASKLLMQTGVSSHHEVLPCDSKHHVTAMYPAGTMAE